jgi:alkyl hydroperoxide reductase subunit AhpC
MISSLVVALWACGAGELALPPAGTLLSYQGQVAQRNEQGEAGDPEKSFDLTLLIDVVDEERVEAYWLLDEVGRGHWPWMERVGKDSLFDADRGTRAALYYEREEGVSVVPLRSPLLLSEEELAPGVTWEDEGETYRVGEKTEYEGRPAWPVEVQNRLGRKGQLWLDVTGSLLLGWEERLFMGRGVEYRLSAHLTARRELPAETAKSWHEAFAATTELRNKVAREPRSQDPQWSAPQRATLTEALGPVEQVAMGTPLEGIARLARRDLEQQASRADELAELRDTQIGRKVEPFEVKGLAGVSLSADELAGELTVLHFWDYRDEPLHEPYGQVGYLDFLYDKLKGSGLRVYGVAVNGQLGAEATRSHAARSAQRLKSFMNLSYPILLDDGALLSQFGDPRVRGGALPLFVVIDREGKVSHYHVGHYQVDRDQGLVELSQAIRQMSAP